MFDKSYWLSLPLPAMPPGLVEAKATFDKKPTAGSSRGFFCDDPRQAGWQPMSET
jgi:hypothetical protein